MPAQASSGWTPGRIIALAHGAGVPVILDSPLELPQREDEPYDAQFTGAGKLSSAGVLVLFNEGGGEGSNVRNYPQVVATAVTFGFPREKAVAAMTLERAHGGEGAGGPCDQLPSGDIAEVVG